MAKSFKNYVNEGILDKALTYLIKNVDFVKKQYIDQNYNYGNGLPFEVKSIKKVKESSIKGLDYVVVQPHKGKEILCLLDNKSTKATSYDWEEIEDAVKDGTRVLFTISQLPKLENNGIKPLLITKVSINGDKQ